MNDSRRQYGRRDTPSSIVARQDRDAKTGRRWPVDAQSCSTDSNVAQRGEYISGFFVGGQSIDKGHARRSSHAASGAVAPATRNTSESARPTRPSSSNSPSSRWGSRGHTRSGGDDCGLARAIRYVQTAMLRLRRDLIAGLPSDSPPPFLPLHLTTLPLSLVQPPTHSTTSNTAPQPLITLTPTHNQRIPTPSPRRANLVLDTDTSEKIETPGWVVVKPGEDDAEEAREEMGGGAVRLSPLKRLRRLPHDDVGVLFGHVMKGLTAARGRYVRRVLCWPASTIRGL